MAKSQKDWSPSEEKLGEVLTQLHKHLSNAGAAEARLVDELLVEILDNETTLDGYIDSLKELEEWAIMSRIAVTSLKWRRTNPKDWSPHDDKLADVLQALHKHLSNAGAAEARLVDALLVEILDNETDQAGYMSSLEELEGWAQMAKARLLQLQKTGK